MEFGYDEYTYNAEEVQQTAEEISQLINSSWSIINTISTYKVTWESIFVVEAGFTRNIDEAQLEGYKTQYRDALESEYASMGDIELTQYTNIGASFGDYIKSTARLTLLLAIIGIAFYIAYAFSGSVGWISSVSFALITIVTLFHDVVISAGLFILTSMVFPQFQIDTFFITALLTILWYSINDTIVIFDRIRSNLQEFGWKTQSLTQIINNSVNETMTRSIYTSMTIAFVLMCIIVFGPKSITGFTLTMLYGTIIGTFSSIFIASPLLYELHKKTVLTVYQKKEDRSDEDKMVV